MESLGNKKISCDYSSSSVHEGEKEPSGQKRKYIQVDYEKRKELIQVIHSSHSTIKAAAEKLNINYPTAKNIVKLYKREHRINKLPKRPNLTLKKITSPAPKFEDGLCRDALSPFYNQAEAERILRGLKRSPLRDCGGGKDKLSSCQDKGVFGMSDGTPMCLRTTSAQICNI